jgi:adenylate cyclase
VTSTRGQPLRNHRAFPRWILVAVLTAFAIGLQWFSRDLPLASAVDHLVGDRLHQVLASAEPEDRIVVIDIDESSISALGPWPWPRARIADLLEALAGPYGARAVGLDIVFPSPADAAGDARLAALADFAPVVLAQALDFVPRDRAVASGVPVFDAPRLDRDAVSALPATGYLANHAGLAQAHCVGNIGLRTDGDGRVRRAPLLASWNGRVSALLPAAMLACPLQRGKPIDPFARLPNPVRASAEWELPFAREWEAYTVIPARAILDGSAPADLVRGRWVLVGSSALGLNDRAATPLAAGDAGVMVHAAAMTSLLDQAQGRNVALPFDGRWIAALWTLLTLAAGAWALGRFKAWWLVPATIAVVPAWLALAAWLVSRGAAFSPSAPLLAYILMLFVITIELWLTQREQGQLLRSFASYVAPSVLREILRLGLDNPMLPQHREITVLAADMQDYTGLTNRSSLQDAAQLTREFLQCLTEPILACGGTLDKYTGDGLVAFWGAPIPDAGHATQALEAARAIVENVRAWNERRVAQGLAPARVRLGIESGHVLVGDLGTRFRRTYTAVGDCINTASKLQAAAKNLSCDLLVGPAAARLAAGSGLAPVTQMQLPGHQQASVLWSFPTLRSSLPEQAAREAVAAATGGR